MLPINCPSCQGRLKVKSLACEACGTQVEGLYELPLLARLSVEDQAFILQFVACSGSLKEMARQRSLSYPTVRNMLDAVIEKLSRS